MAGCTSSAHSSAPTTTRHVAIHVTAAVPTTSSTTSTTLPLAPPASTPTTTVYVSPNAPRCRPSQLRLESNGDDGAAMGSADADFFFVNISHVRCTLHGHPTLHFADVSGGLLRIETRLDDGSDWRAVGLDPPPVVGIALGAHAYFGIFFADWNPTVPANDSMQGCIAPCRVLAYLPGDATPLGASVRYQLMVCGLVFVSAIGPESSFEGALRQDAGYP
jgi:hypothetical protein